MATYNPSSLGIKPPAGGFKQGGWYSGRQYWGGTLSDPGVIHPSSDQQGAGQAVSKEVNAQSAALQGVSSAQLEAYLQQERAKQAAANVKPVSTGAPSLSSSLGASGPSGPGNIRDVPTINLPELYKKLLEGSGIKGYQEEYDTLTKDIEARLAAKNEAEAGINDNPFYSEGTRVGRVRKLDEKYNADVQAIAARQANVQNKIATQKADIETQLNIQTKQFDIDSQVARDALNQFNTLLGLGALDNASGEDIANITRSTGLSSNMIYSAIQSNKDSKVQTSTIQYDDGTNQGFAIINSKTGEIISTQVVAPSKPTGGGKATESEQKSYYANALRSDAQRGLTLSQIFGLYTGYLNPDDIYRLYNANSKYGPDKGDIGNLAKYGVTQPK